MAEVRKGKPKMAHAFIKREPGQEPRSTFKVDVNIVMVRASVMDRMNRSVLGLDKENFRLYEDKVEQDIIYFSQEDKPISFGIIFDISGSMKPHFAAAKKSIVQLLEKGHEGDEFFLITFNNKVSLDVDFTNQATDVRNSAAIRLPGGRTALYDGVYMGLDKLQEARNERKVLIIITDGEDNSSRYTFREVKELARESDVQIYALAQQGTLPYGTISIQDLVSLTGGRCFFPYTFDQLEYYVNQIHDEMRNQYVLGYHSNNKSRSGKWRKIKIHLEPPQGSSKLTVRAREGYYAQKD